MHPHPPSFQARILVSKEERGRLDEFAATWKGRKVSEYFHTSNGHTEILYSFINEYNMKQFESQLSLFHAVKVIPHIEE